MDDCSQARDGDSLSERQLPLQSSLKSALWMDRLSELLALRSELQGGGEGGGCGDVFYPQKWDMICVFP